MPQIFCCRTNNLMLVGVYDHGLRTPAKGPQSWQRALPKTFFISRITLWKGSSLNDKSILLLEEQAIGDVMQFITLVPSFSARIKTSRLTCQ